jgi:hypothetical protein
MSEINIISAKCLRGEKTMLSKGEILIILGLYILGGKATTMELAKITKTPEAYIRNIVLKLREKRIIRSLSSSDIRGLSLGFMPADVSTPTKSKQNIHILIPDFEELLEEYPEIFQWASSVFNVKTKEELISHLNQLKQQLKQ